MTGPVSPSWLCLLATYYALYDWLFGKSDDCINFIDIHAFSYGDANETPLIRWSDSISLFRMVSDYTRLLLKVRSVNGLFSCNVLCYF